MQRHRTIILLVSVLGAIFFAVLALIGSLVVKAPTTTPPKTYTVTLERGPCFGFCPAYKVIVRSDGKVDFFGELYSTGDYSYSIDKDQLARLIAKVESVDVFKYKDEYVDQRITDLPSAKLTIDDGTRQKSISLYGLKDTIPTELIQLTKLIDEVADTKQWFATPS